MINRALLFPGQGAHDLCMLNGLMTSRKFKVRYECVCESLKCNPLKEIEKGNTNFLHQNKISSILTVFVSTLSLDIFLQKANEVPQSYAGYSVGQWTALYAAKAVSFEKLIEIVKNRAELMDACFNDKDGGMMAIIGVSEDSIKSFIRDIQNEGQYIEISNYNCLGQYSIAGTKEAIQLAFKRVDSIQPKKKMILPVQGAWHCALLGPSEKEFLKYLQNIDLKTPIYPLVDNYTGTLFPNDIDQMKLNLAKHICHPVLWEKSIKTMIAMGCSEFIEIGYGNVLTKFGFFINRDVEFKTFYS